MKQLWRITRTAGLVLALWITAVLAAPVFPKLTGRVVDNANLLSAQTERSLTDKLKALEDQTTDQVVVTLPNLQGETIEQFDYQIGRYWGIGQKDQNNGALLIVAVKERKVRIEVGYGLEGTLTDALTKVIVDTATVLRFKAGDFQAGIRAGVSDIVAALRPGTDGVQKIMQRREGGRVGLTLNRGTIWAIILLLYFIYVVIQIFRGKPVLLGNGNRAGSWTSSGGGWSDGGSSEGW